MRTIIVMAVFLGAAAPALAQSPSPGGEPPVVVVRGEGIVRSAPDQLWIRIGAESRSKSPREAQATNAAAMTAVQSRLAAAGIPKDAIRTIAVSLQQEFDYVGGRQTPRGFVARNAIEVRVDDLAKSGDVMDASVGSGATSIQGMRFDVKQRDLLEREALKRATADAMARAESAASGVKRVVDRVLKIEEGGMRLPPPQPMAFSRAADTAAGAPPTPIAEGEIEIRAQVMLTVAIK
jgi:uncharacterized protein YggE